MVMRIAAFLLLTAVALPALAQRRIDFLVDVEGVRRTGRSTQFSPGTVRYDPDFETGGGIGAGVNVFLSGRVSVEVKAAALRSHLRVRRFGSDFVAVADLGNAQLYPITALVQWHPFEKGSFRPYVGAGAGHIILRNIESTSSNGDASTVRFDDPTGLVLDAGTELIVSKRWSATGDVRYVPMETSARARFAGGASSELNVRPLIVSFGLAYHF